MLVKLKIRWRESSHVDDSEEVFLAWHYWELAVLCFIDQKRIWNWFGAIVVIRVIYRLVVIDQGRSFRVVKIADRQNILRINAIRSVHIVDKERASESVDILSTNVSMIPVSTRLVNDELIDKYSTRLDWALGHHRRAVRIGCVDLMNTVEMNGSCLISKVVRYSDDNGIAHVDLDGWARPLSIDTDEGSRKPIRRSLYPSNAPSVTSSCRRWRCDIGVRRNGRRARC